MYKRVYSWFTLQWSRDSAASALGAETEDFQVLKMREDGSLGLGTCLSH